MAYPGPVVRTSPKELSFITASSYGDIYGHRGKGHGVFRKTAVYDAAAFTAQTRSIVNERDPAEHARMRRLVSPAFSEKALRMQHPFIAKATDALIEELGRPERLGQPIDLSTWFSLVSFDIVTNLSLGEDFATVRAAKRHPWNVFFGNAAHAMADAIVLLRVPILKRIVLAFPPPQMKAMIKELRLHEDYCIKAVKKCVCRRVKPRPRPLGIFSWPEVATHSLRKAANPGPHHTQQETRAPDQPRRHYRPDPREPGGRGPLDGIHRSAAVRLCDRRDGHDLRRPLDRALLHAAEPDHHEEGAGRDPGRLRHLRRHYARRRRHGHIHALRHRRPRRGPPHYAPRLVGRVSRGPARRGHGLWGVYPRGGECPSPLDTTEQ